jgi:YggT family protein
MNETVMFILRSVIDIYACLLLIRLLLQLVQANFFNPVCQTIFKVCAPVVEPLSRLLPTIGSFNIAALVAAVLVKWSFYLLMMGFGAVAMGEIFAYLAVAGFELLRTLIEIYFWGIFILVISSWVGTTQHPTVALVAQVVDPYMRPFRNLIPPIGMIDISPMAAIFTLMFIRAKVLPMLGSLILPFLS